MDDKATPPQADTKPAGTRPNADLEEANCELGINFSTRRLEVRFGDKAIHGYSLDRNQAWEFAMELLKGVRLLFLQDKVDK